MPGQNFVYTDRINIKQNVTQLFGRINNPVRHRRQSGIAGMKDIRDKTLVFIFSGFFEQFRAFKRDNRMDHARRQPGRDHKITGLQHLFVRLVGKPDHKKTVDEQPQPIGDRDVLFDLVQFVVFLNLLLHRLVRALHRHRHKTAPGFFQ